MVRVRYSRRDLTVSHRKDTQDIGEVELGVIGPPAVTMRRFVAEQDMEAVFALWQAALGERWPLTSSEFRGVVGTPKASSMHIVAEDHTRIVGFVHGAAMS